MQFRANSYVLSPSLRTLERDISFSFPFFFVTFLVSALLFGFGDEYGGRIFLFLRGERIVEFNVFFLFPFFSVSLRGGVNYWGYFISIFFFLFLLFYFISEG